MLTRILLTLSLGVYLSAELFAQEKKDESLAKAKGLVEKKLEELKADGAKVEVIVEKDLRELFPNHVFVAVHYPLWPVARVPAEPLRSQNLFAVSRDDKVTHLPDPMKLDEFFKSTLGKNPNKANTVKSWLRLNTEYVQDGFFKFKAPSEVRELPEKSNGNQGFTGFVEVVPEAGNRGKLISILHFNFETGDFSSAKNTNEVLAGIRPRCQATLLLHSEKLVREIAEQDLIVMGKMAKGYLMDQRAKAGAELRREIDRVWGRIEAEKR